MQPAPRGPSLAQTQYVAQPGIQAYSPPQPAQPTPQPVHPPSSSNMQVAPPPSSRPNAGKLGNQTVVGVTSPVSQRNPQPQAAPVPAQQYQQPPAQQYQPPPQQYQAAPQYQAPPQYQPPAQYQPQPAQQPSEPPKYARASHPGFAPAPPPPGQAPAPKKQALGATMIGVPGVIPQSPGPAAPAAAPAKGIPKGTLLGVAMPGVAPTQQPAQPAYPQQPVYRPQPSYAQPPQAQQPAPPEERVSLPEVSVARPSRVVPIVLVVLALVAVLVTLVLVLRPSGPPPITSSIEGEANAPKLVVKCGTCADGSAIDLGGKAATFASGSASLALSSTDLKAGRNVFRGKVTPKDKKPQDVELEVLIPYLVHPSLAPLGKGESKVDIVFDLADDVKSVTVDGTKLEKGAKTYGVVIPAPAEDARVFDKSVGYEVEQQTGPVIKGSLELKIPYATLRSGLPGRRAFVVGDSIEVSGKTGAGATIQIGETTLTADDTGVYKGKVKVDAEQKELKLRAFGSKLAPRSLVLPIAHAASVEEISKTLRAEAVKTSFEKVADKPDEFVGKVVWTKLEVQQVGEEDGRVVAIGETKCPTASESKCPAVKVLVSPGTTVAKGDVIEVLGVVVRAVSSEKTKATAVEVDASWVSKTK